MPIFDVWETGSFVKLGNVGEPADTTLVFHVEKLKKVYGDKVPTAIYKANNDAVAIDIALQAFNDNWMWIVPDSVLREETAYGTLIFNYGEAKVVVKTNVGGYSDVHDESGDGTGSMKRLIVDTLPATGTDDTIYLIENGSGEGNIYAEYIWISQTSEFEKVGDFDISILNGYATETYVQQIANTKVNKTTTINGHDLSSNVTLTKSDMGLANADNTSDLDKPISTATQTALDNKVNTETGKGLSTNDYTAAEKTKLAGIESGAQVNPSPASAAPLMDGTPAAGSSDDYARGDHVHPTDTSRASQTDFDAQAERIALLHELINGIDAPIYRKAGPANPVAVSDGYPANVKALSVDIAPAQSFNGYNHPWPGGAGKNLLNAPATLTHSNPNGWYSSTVCEPIVLIPGQTYTLTSVVTRFSYQEIFIGTSTNYYNLGYGMGSAPNGNVFIENLRNNRGFTYAVILGNGSNIKVTFTASEIEEGQNLYFYIIHWSSNLGGTISFTNPQLESGSVATAYEPYANICPISGLDSVSVRRTGKNIFNPGTSRTIGSGDNIITVTVAADGLITLSGKKSESDWNPLLGSITLKPGVWQLSILDKIGDGGHFLDTNYQEQPQAFTVTVPEGSTKAYYLAISSAAVGTDISVSFRVQVERGNVTTDYEPYQTIQIITVSFVDPNSDPLTVYIGTLDVTNGVLTVTSVYRTITSQSNIIAGSGLLPGGYYFNYNSAFATDSENSVVCCDTLPVFTNITEARASTAAIYSENGYVNFKVSTELNDNVSAMKEWLAEHPISYVHMLKAPETYQLTATQLGTLAGVNIISASAESVTVEYRADPTLS